MERLVFLVRAVVSLVLGGDTCVRCGKDALVFPLCRSCLRSLMRDAAAGEVALRCEVCGKELVSEISRCSACRNQPVLRSTDGVYPVYAYRLWKKSLLFAWKSEGRRALSPIFARIMQRALTVLEKKRGAKQPLALVPVPPRSGKIRRRGWDQIDELCRLLRRKYGRTVLPLLERKSLVQQKKLGRGERLGQSKTAYTAVGKERLGAIAPVLPEEVVLIDDVLTTGATIEACARQLKLLGVQRVYAATLFVVD